MLSVKARAVAQGQVYPVVEVREVVLLFEVYGDEEKGQHERWCVISQGTMFD